MHPFVIQQHSTRKGGVHYDLMLDLGDGGRLATWRLPQLPAGEGTDMAAHKLADHRRAYLTYEGPVSGDRGEVQIVAAGMYETECREGDRWILRLVGEVVSGRIELRRDPAGGADAWRVTVLSDA